MAMKEHRQSIRHWCVSGRRRALLCVASLCLLLWYAVDFDVVYTRTISSTQANRDTRSPGRMSDKELAARKQRLPLCSNLSSSFHGITATPGSWSVHKSAGFDPTPFPLQASPRREGGGGDDDGGGSGSCFVLDAVSSELQQYRSGSWMSSLLFGDWYFFRDKAFDCMAASPLSQDWGSVSYLVERFRSILERQGFYSFYPHECRMLRLSSDETVELYAERTVIFAGDSTSKAQFRALLAAMSPSCGKPVVESLQGREPFVDNVATTSNAIHLLKAEAKWANQERNTDIFFSDARASKMTETVLLAKEKGDGIFVSHARSECHRLCGGINLCWLQASKVSKQGERTPYSIGDLYADVAKAGIGEDAM